MASTKRESHAVFQTLPIEIVAGILINLDPDGVISAIRTCRLAYIAYSEFRAPVLDSVFSSVFGRNMHHALAFLYLPEIPLSEPDPNSEWKYRSLIFMKRHTTRALDYECTSNPHALRILGKLAHDITYFVAAYAEYTGDLILGIAPAQAGLRTRPTHAPPLLSANEAARVMRGLLLYELVCNLVGMPAITLQSHLIYVSQPRGGNVSARIDFESELVRMLPASEEEEVREVDIFVRRQHMLLALETKAEFIKACEVARISADAGGVLLDDLVFAHREQLDYTLVQESDSYCTVTTRFGLRFLKHMLDMSSLSRRTFLRRTFGAIHRKVNSEAQIRVLRIYPNLPPGINPRFTFLAHDNFLYDAAFRRLCLLSNGQPRSTPVRALSDPVSEAWGGPEEAGLRRHLAFGEVIKLRERGWVFWDGSRLSQIANPTGRPPQRIYGHMSKWFAEVESGGPEPLREYLVRPGLTMLVSRLKWESQVLPGFRSTAPREEWTKIKLLASLARQFSRL
ncbi:hypothetical protein B0T25DRAFT_169730 [Lasiosphaeria hispida]|uniref:Uncharacterized protein n=1 Tax=Lasiosphaeria hispida TaxID=260671 RepID=A0AAJ0MGS4_9PEZI|nr:hypothetical protein B0T25DRAFT_169730 [Lasiosphaeria hispida]